MNTNTKIKLTTEEYDRTDSGKSWKSKPHTVETKIITPEQHEKMTNESTCKWFRRLGGSETVTRSYTSQGYIVTQLVSCDPSRTIKKVRQFDIVGD